MPACDRIWFFVRVEDSDATSTSVMREFAADRFCCVTARFEIVTCMRFCDAPSFERAVDSCWIALSKQSIADWAPAAVDSVADAMCRPAVPRVDVVSFVMLIEMRSFAVLLMPT